MLRRPPTRSTTDSCTIAICGNPNCGKTTIFNAITGLNQHVANYPGVTVEKVSGRFTVADNTEPYTLVDIPGTYSLSAFSPDEDIAVSALSGSLPGTVLPDAIICVLDATHLERSLAFLLQVMEIGRPVVAAVNMVDLAERHGLQIDYQKMSEALGGIPVVPVVGNRQRGISELKQAVQEAISTKVSGSRRIYGDDVESLIDSLHVTCQDGHRTRAGYLRIIFDVEGEAERRFREEESDRSVAVLREGRRRIRAKHGSLSMAETSALSRRASEIFEQTVFQKEQPYRSTSERIDRYLLHPVLGPIVLGLTMIIVFQSIFSWAEPIMDLIDGFFGSLATTVAGSMSPGPLRSLLTNGIIGGVGSVLIFIPQIVILFVFISMLEDSGYMSRAAFLVDRLFRWCGLSGKSFIPMLSSFACAIPGILATRTIEDRKLRIITMMVAPLMTCSARLPVYAIMIAAFIPYRTYLGIFNLQGIVLTVLYLVGIVVAIVVSFVLKQLVFKTERGSFMLELPSYKMPTFKSVGIRVFNRARAFVYRAGTVILAITVIIWALGYFPHEKAISSQFEQEAAQLEAEYAAVSARLGTQLEAVRETVPPEQGTLLHEIETRLETASTPDEMALVSNELMNRTPELSAVIGLAYEIHARKLDLAAAKDSLANAEAGAHIRNSYFSRIGRTIAPLFAPLGWDWKVSMAALAAFPAREVIIATLGTIYNLGSEVDEESTSLIDKMRQARWEEGARKGELVFSPAVALSIMIFFALCCQCGATLVTIKKETSTWKYAVFTFAYMTSLAYLCSMGAYQLFSQVWY